MIVAPHRWIDLATTATYQAMRDGRCVRNACIEAGCIAVGVAQNHSYLCEPVPAAVCVSAGKEATVLPGVESRRRDGFAGHLVVFYPGADIMVDLTADQFDAPARGLHVPGPLVVSISRDDLAAGMQVHLPTGTTVQYREMVGDVSWRALPAWYESSRLTIGHATRLLHAMIESDSRRRGRRRVGASVRRRA